jgi:hypothetical protein
MALPYDEQLNAVQNDDTLDYFTRLDLLERIVRSYNPSAFEDKSVNNVAPETVAKTLTPSEQSAWDAYNLAMANRSDINGEKNLALAKQQLDAVAADPNAKVAGTSALIMKGVETRGNMTPAEAAAADRKKTINSLVQELGKDEPAYRKIAEGLANQGIESLKDIQYTRTPQYENQQLTFQPRDQNTEDGFYPAGYYYGGKKLFDVNDPKIADLKAKGEWQEKSYYDPDYGGYTVITAKLPNGGFDESWINKATGKPINTYRFGMLGNGEGGISGGDLFFNLAADASGNVTVVPDWSPRARSQLREIAPVIGVGLLLIPGIGQAIGASILGGSAATVAATVGLSVTAVTTAVGAATLSAGMTALQGGSVEDVIKAGVSAGVASGVNFAAGGGVPGAVSGSVAGTVLQGGNVSQVVTNAFAAGVGAGVQGALPENPDAGKIIGSAARTYIATGGDLDKTLLNTAATAVGTLDQPAATAQQTQAASTPAKISESLVRFEDGGLLYEEQPDGTGKVTDQAGNERIISSREFSRIANADTTAPPVTPPAPTDATGLERITVSAPAPAPVISPTVTGTDLINQVAAQPVTTVDPKTLERVIVQGQGANAANVVPVVSPTVTGTDLINQVAEQPVTTVDSKALERVIVQGQRDTANVANVAPVQTEITTPRPDTTRGLPPVTVTATTEKLPEPGFEEYKPIPEPKVSDVVTDVPPTTPPDTPPPSLDRVVVTGQRDLVDPFVDIAPPPPPPEVVTPFVAPPVAPPPSLPPVEVVAKAEQLPEPGFEEYKPLPEPKISDVVTDVVAPPPPAPPPSAPIVPEVKAEEPKKEEPPKKPEKIYPTVTGVPPVVPSRAGRQPIITGVSPARLLADALAAYRPAGAIEGEESGKERQNVWNEKSLRLKDALGL